jgi:hypothetical protein
LCCVIWLEYTAQNAVADMTATLQINGKCEARECAKINEDADG